MHQLPSEHPIRILALDSPDAFDTVEADDIEACRRAFGFTPTEFAEQLGWSPRKYQRCLEAAREDRFAERDVALAVRGLLDVLLGTDDHEVKSVHFAAGAPHQDARDAMAFGGGRIFADFLPKILADCGPWTADVTPHLLRLAAERATKGKRITYGEAATTLEEAGLTHRVWPRTLYGMPLGAICDVMMMLGRETKTRVPLLSTIVVRASGQPGPGVDPMIRKFVQQHAEGEQAKELLTRLKRDRDGLIAELQQEVFAFLHWPGVLRALGLQTG